MALIFRSVFKVSDGAVDRDALTIFRSWLSAKAHRADEVDAGAVDALELTAEPTTLGPWKVEVVQGRAEQLSGFLGRLTEQKSDQTLTTTFRVVGVGQDCWASIDLDREWTDGGEFGASWLPWPPALVKTVLSGYVCTRGPVRLDGTVEEVSRQSVRSFLSLLTDPERDVPCVVVTRSQPELQGDVADEAPARASNLANRLVGVAKVALFEPMVAQDFSALVGGPPWDVHSGAVRTYLPGFKRESDYPQRHRIVHFRRLDGMPPGTVARLAAWRLINDGAHRKLPDTWRSITENLPAFTSGHPDRDWQEIAEELDSDLALARTAVEELSEVQNEAREEVAGALMVVERLQARERYLRDALRAAKPELDIDAELHVTEESTVYREQCATVVGEAQAKLPNIVFYDIDKVKQGAELLDEHSEPAFARKGWQVLSALNEFAEVNARGSFGGSFLDYCQSGEATNAIQPKWVRMKESETTDQNKRYRDARTFKVPKEVEPSGIVYMGAHVALEAGGYPAPRIHFHDDTRETGKVYVGWFGPHLDNKLKN
jgi:hypothetical protein